MVAEKAQPKSVVLREEEKARKALELAEKNAAEIQSDAVGSYFKSEDISLLRRDVVIHPIPLLSITDHYTRSASGTNRRVVGCLLGEMIEGKVHITNSFGVPFEENSKDLSVWFVDSNYLNKMYKMFKKINARETIVGWYSSAGMLNINDTHIHELFRKYHPNPILLVVDVKGTKSDSTIQTYYSFEQPSQENRRVFMHTKFTLATSEAEQVGLEHLLRDTETSLETTLGTTISNKAEALKTAAQKLEQITEYLRMVAAGKLPEQSHIMAQLQNLLNSLPDKSDPQLLAQGFQKYTNDALFASYIGFATRAVLAIHDLTLNKKQLRENNPNNIAQSTATTSEEKTAAA